MRWPRGSFDHHACTLLVDPPVSKEQSVNVDFRFFFFFFVRSQPRRSIGNPHKPVSARKGVLGSHIWSSQCFWERCWLIVDPPTLIFVEWSRTTFREVSDTCTHDFLCSINENLSSGAGNIREKEKGETDRILQERHAHEMPAAWMHKTAWLCLWAQHTSSVMNIQATA